MRKPKLRHEESVRETRIANEIVVDAYNESERALAWYYHLDEQLKFPFPAKCRHTTELNWLRVGDIVSVIGLAKEDLCRAEIFVRIMNGVKSFAVPLWQLEPITNDTATVQAVGDWHYWRERGYEF